MMWISTVFQIIQLLLTGYMFAISARIIISWFPSARYNKAYDLLKNITDPYLDLFKGIRFLRSGAFDFTPIAAIMGIVLVRDIFSQLGLYPGFSLGIVLLVAVNVLWNTVNWILILFLIIAGVRLVSLFLHTNPTALLWGNLDLMIQPFVLFIMRFHLRKTSYQNLLVIVCLFLGLLVLAGNFLLMPALNHLIRLIPF
jgi:YggT family protein